MQDQTINEFFHAAWKKDGWDQAKNLNQARFMKSQTYAPSTAVLQGLAALDNDAGGISFTDMVLGSGYAGGAEDMLFLGARLIQKKTDWGKDFTRHLHRLGISPSSAYLWMRCARRFLDHDGTGNLVCKVYGNLPISVLYQILRDDIPDETVTDILSGKHIQTRRRHEQKR